MSGLQQLIDRPRRSPWEDFLRSPVLFVSQFLYSRNQRPPSQIRTREDGVSVVCISDTHNSQPPIPHADLLIHAGDLTQSGSFAEIQTTLEWLQGLPHRYKVVVAGNHDVLLDEKYDRTSDDESQRAKLEWGDIIYLQNEETTLEINGRELRIYGSPLSAKNGNWAFQYPRTQDPWTIPSKIDILITHGPPRAHLDCLFGCTYLLQHLWRVRPKLHVFGHVHEGHGREWLKFDGLQRAFERVVTERGGVVNGLRVGWEALRGLFGDERDERRGTLLVNPAMVGGLRDKLRMRATVVEI